MRCLLVKKQVENEHTATWCANSQLYHTQPPLAVFYIIYVTDYFNLNPKKLEDVEKQSYHMASGKDPCPKH